MLPASATRAAHRLLHVDLVPLATLSREERAGLSVADDLALRGIPLEFAAQTHRDVREMADFQHPVV